MYSFSHQIILPYFILDVIVNFIHWILYFPFPSEFSHHTTLPTALLWLQNYSSQLVTSPRLRVPCYLCSSGFWHSFISATSGDDRSRRVSSLRRSPSSWQSQRYVVTFVCFYLLNSWPTLSWQMTNLDLDLTLLNNLHLLIFLPKLERKIICYSISRWLAF